MLPNFGHDTIYGNVSVCTCLLFYFYRRQFLPLDIKFWWESKVKLLSPTLNIWCLMSKNWCSRSNVWLNTSWFDFPCQILIVQMLSLDMAEHCKCAIWIYKFFFQENKNRKRCRKNPLGHTDQSVYIQDIVRIIKSIKVYSTLLAFHIFFKKML